MLKRGRELAFIHLFFYVFVVLSLSANQNLAVGNEVGFVHGAIIPKMPPRDLNAAPPVQRVDPVRFWLEKNVIQVRGIVVEDPDFIVRDRYWVLNDVCVGVVVAVDDTLNPCVCSVRFSGQENWQQKGFEKQVEGTVETKIVHDGYETHVLQTFVRNNGVQVEPSICGLIQASSQEQGVVVRFPVSLLSLERPRMGDEVIRAADWRLGYADGGGKPVGLLDKREELECLGTIVGNRTEDGVMRVRWAKTERISLVRFDQMGFFDVMRKMQ